MCVMNEIDRFSLVRDVVDRLPQLGHRAAYVRQEMYDKHLEHKQYVSEHGIDMPEVLDWTWPS
jgi:xylulose-5-phosphate/fructose-6-phosphate phosphoketolase